MPPVSTKNKTPASHQPTDNAFRELIRVFGLVERIMQPYFAQFGISGAQWSVLRNLHRAEQEGHAGLRLTDLSERLLVRPPSVTGVVDRLEKVGLVSRVGDPEDLRAKQVALTDKGRRLLERVLAAHQGQLDAVMSGLSRAEQDELHRLLGKLGRHLTGMANHDTN
jgi:MarR family 2-MHQ and catechol resistance regulon transcriptional repressor